jgi:hypothetical protein
MPRSQHFEGGANVRRSTPGPCITTLVSLATTLNLALSRLVGATTVNANSASLSDVAAAVASATNGDTVIIPGGTASWTRTLPVRKAITIQGAGVGVTIIKDNVQDARLISITLVAGKLTRLTGIEFQNGGRQNGGGPPGGTIHVEGSNTNGSQFRFDHSAWNLVNGDLVCDTVIGVIDHNQWTKNSNAGAIIIYGSHWNEPGGRFGDGSWAAPTNFGSSQFLFIEDNTFNCNLPSYVLPITDAYGGSRFVVRHNTIHDGFVTEHGTESTGRIRGARAVEVYNNTYAGTNQNHFVGGLRSGTLLFHDNSVSGYWNNPIFALANHRSFFPFGPWGGADGTNRWDVNEPNTFFTGTAAQNSSGTTVTVSGASWTPNQWASYTLRRTSDHCHSGSLNFGEISGNTSNTITYSDNGGYAGQSMSFCAGDSLEIRKVDHAIDQPGRAGGSLISGDNPIPPPGWNNQVTEPCYAWNNGNAKLSAVHGSIRQGVDYFNNKPMPGYTPYTYPHPLTKGLLPPEQVTRNTTENSQHDLRKKRQPWGGKKLDTKKAKKAKESPTNRMTDDQDNLGN